MEVFKLVGNLVLDGSDKIQQQLDAVNNKLQDVQAQFRAVGAAMAGIGAAGLKFSSDARKQNALIAQTAITLGVEQGALRRVETATANVTFPLQEVIDTFELLARGGMTSVDEIAKTATAFDTLGDSIGLNASQVSEILIPAFKSFGIPLTEAGKNVDKFTWLVHNTEVNLDDFASILTYLAPDMDKLGISMDDAVAILAALEAKGISGSAATRLFRSAVTEATNTGESLADALGLTSAEIDKYKAKLDSATGITQKYADAANTQYGLLDKLKFILSQVTFSLGSFLEPFEPIMGAMSSLGLMFIAMPPLVGGISKVFKALSGVLGLVSRAFVGLIGLLIANPVFLVITIAIGALIAAGVELAKHWDEVAKFFKILWADIQIAFADGVKAILKFAIAPFLQGIGGILSVVGKVVGVFNKDWGRAIQNAADDVTNVIKKIDEWTDTVKENAAAYKDQVTAEYNAKKEAEAQKTAGVIPGTTTGLMQEYNAAVSAMQLATTPEEQQKAREQYLEAIDKITQEQATYYEKNVLTGEVPAVKSTETTIETPVSTIDTSQADVNADNLTVDNLTIFADKVNLVTGAVPGLQTGGVVTKPTVAMIGERGAEAVIPLSKMGQVFSLKQIVGAINRSMSNLTQAFGQNLTVPSAPVWPEQPIASVSNVTNNLRESPIHVHIEVEGREMAQYVLRHLANDARLKGVRC
jgi:hypothetical protein